MTATPDLLVYRVPADEPAGIHDVPERLRPFLDSCRHCHDGAIYTPTSLRHDPDQTVCSYDCSHSHYWTRGYTNP